MQIILNGEARDVPEGTTLAELIADMALTGRRIALEVNEDIVPRSLHDQHRLQAGDRVEIVHAIGGG